MFSRVACRRGEDQTVNASRVGGGEFERNLAGEGMPHQHG
jgi:hypothetical protein